MFPCHQQKNVDGVSYRHGDQEMWICSANVSMYLQHCHPPPIHFILHPPPRCVFTGAVENFIRFGGSAAFALFPIPHLPSIHHSPQLWTQQIITPHTAFQADRNLLGDGRYEKSEKALNPVSSKRPLMVLESLELN